MQGRPSPLASHREETVSTKISGARLLVRALRAHGLDRIFGLCGDHVNVIFDACVDENVAIVDARHESGAAHMADAWARMTGKPGVSVVTGGPGHINSLTGLATPWEPEVPHPPSGAVEAALAMLHSAERPALIAGSALLWSRAYEPLRRVVETLSVPCFTVGMARGAISDDHPLCFGYADPVQNP